MKTSKKLIALGLATVIWGAYPVIAHASPPDGQICAALDSGKIDTSGDPMTVTITAPEGQLISGYCVKAASTVNGGGAQYFDLDPDVSSVTISYTDADGKDKAISHYSYSLVPVPTETTGTSSSTTSGGTSSNTTTTGTGTSSTTTQPTSETSSTTSGTTTTTSTTPVTSTSSTTTTSGTSTASTTTSSTSTGTTPVTNTSTTSSPSSTTSSTAPVVPSTTLTTSSVVITPEETPPPGSGRLFLAFTGSQAPLFVTWALVLILLGSAFLVVAKRSLRVERRRH